MKVRKRKDKGKTIYKGKTRRVGTIEPTPDGMRVYSLRSGRSQIIKNDDEAIDFIRKEQKRFG